MGGSASGSSTRSGASRTQRARTLSCLRRTPWGRRGTLLSPTLYLTAGHCTEAPAARAEIWFQADVESGIPGNGYPFRGQARVSKYHHPSGS